MRDKAYYSVRTGTNPSGGKLDLEDVIRVFQGMYSHLEDEGYFQEAFGFDCIDQGYVAGRLGPDIEGVILLELQKTDIWPIRRMSENYSEDDLFDVIEFLHEWISKPVKRKYHSWSECGWHCESFDQNAGRSEFRDKVDNLLGRYKDGFELSREGEIFSLPEDGLAPLINAMLPTTNRDNVEKKVAAAKAKFLRYRASNEDRGDAIRDLAGVLEYLKPEAKMVLTTKDEADLFELANKFGIRHRDGKQKD